MSRQETIALLSWLYTFNWVEGDEGQCIFHSFPKGFCHLYSLPSSVNSLLLCSLSKRLQVSHYLNLCLILYAQFWLSHVSGSLPPFPSVYYTKSTLCCPRFRVLSTLGRGEGFPCEHWIARTGKNDDEWVPALVLLELLFIPRIYQLQYVGLWSTPLSVTHSETINQFCALIFIYTSVHQC